MNILIEDDLSFEEYKDLRNTTSWTKLTDTQIENLIKNSAFKVRAKINGKTGIYKTRRSQRLRYGNEGK